MADDGGWAAARAAVDEAYKHLQQAAPGHEHDAAQANYDQASRRFQAIPNPNALNAQAGTPAKPVIPASPWQQLQNALGGKK